MEQENNQNAIKETVKKTVTSEVKKELPIAQIKYSRDNEPAIQEIEVAEKFARQEPVIIENKLPKQASVVVVVQVKEPESPVSTVETEQDAFDEPNKQTRVGKLLTKLKKIKKAEFEELGIRPESIVAFVKDKTGKH